MHIKKNNNQMNALSPAERQVLSKQVVENIKQAIYDGHIQQGEHIVEEQIASAMKVSRGPIREALVELERQGLVEREIHRGTFVVSLSKNDIEEIYKLRLVLEQLAMEYAINFANSQDLTEMEKVVEELNNLIVNKDFDVHKAVELDLRFHELLVESSRQKRLINYWRDLFSQIKLLLMSRAVSYPKIFNKSSVLSHRDMIDAVRKKELQRGVEILKKHFEYRWIFFSAGIESAQMGRKTDKILTKK